MNQVTVECIEPTSLAEVGDFARSGLPSTASCCVWTTQCNERRKHLLRTIVDDQTLALADFYVLGSVTHLSETIVGQEWQSRDTGAQLMTRIEEMARAVGCHELSPWAAETSPAAVSIVAWATRWKTSRPTTVAATTTLISIPHRWPRA